MYRGIKTHNIILADKQPELISFLDSESVEYTTTSVADASDGIFILDLPDDLKDPSKFNIDDFLSLIPLKIKESLKSKNSTITLLVYVIDAPNIYMLLDALMSSMHALGYDITRVYTTGNSYIPALADGLPHYTFFCREELTSAARLRNKLVPYHNCDEREYIYRYSVNHDTPYNRIFGAALYVHGLVNYGYFSYDKLDMSYNDLIKSPVYKWNNVWENADSMLDMFNIRLPIVPKDRQLTSDMISYIESYINFVPHKSFNIESIILDDDVFNSIYYMQVFMPISAPFTLEAYQSLGYKTFNDLLNEDFDSITNNEERMAIIFKRLYDITYKSDYTISMVINALSSITKYNKQALISPKKYRLLNILDNSAVATVITEAEEITI